MTKGPMADPTAYLTADQVGKMIDSAGNLRDKLLAQLLFRTGIRVSEALGILTKNILWDRDQVIIKALKKRKLDEKGKSIPEMWRPVNIDPNTLALAKEYLERRGNNSHYLFDSDYGAGGKPLTRFAAYKIIRKLAEGVGISKVGITAKYNHPHPHSLRHSFSRFYVDKIVPAEGSISALKKLQTQLGHARQETTMGYIEYNDQETKKSYASLWE